MTDDLISRQAAIDAICDNCETVHAFCPHYPCKKYLAIEALPPTQQWIPVTERLPEPNEREENGCERYYLTQNEYGDMMVCSWNGFKWLQIYQYELMDDEIVAWMPLPIPWKGETE